MYPPTVNLMFLPWWIVSSNCEPMKPFFLKSFCHEFSHSNVNANTCRDYLFGWQPSYCNNVKDFVNISYMFGNDSVVDYFCKYLFCILFCLFLRLYFHHNISSFPNVFPKSPIYLSPFVFKFKAIFNDQLLFHTSYTLYIIHTLYIVYIDTFYIHMYIYHCNLLSLLICVYWPFGTWKPIGVILPG